jgi:eukaryotic-like serine/threonine-protein kinase
MEAHSHRASVLSLVGRTIDDHYHIVSILGEGNMGAVYKAEQKDGPPVAIKVLHEELGDQAELRERFEREFKALFRLEHPNILKVHDFGIVDGAPYLVMELLTGMTLDEFISKHTTDDDFTLSPELAIDIVKQILRGLAHAHAQRAAHRDMKSENVWIQPEADGRVTVKILDFGLVKFTDGKKWSDERKLTMQGMVFGSPGYMPPEQCTGKPTDERSDVYSLGVLLYELLTGAWPFMEENQVLMFQAHLMKPAPSLASGAPAGTRIDPALEALYQKAMAKAPDARFPDAGAMLAALEAIRNPVGGSSSSAASKQPDWRILAAAAAAVVVVAGVLYALL